MAKKPAGTIYWVDEKPPWAVTLLMGLQHLFVMSSTLALPVVLVQEIGGSTSDISTVVCLSMIAAGLGTILQALKKGGAASVHVITVARG